jgi:hypothetical protein
MKEIAMTQTLSLVTSVLLATTASAAEVDVAPDQAPAAEQVAPEPAPADAAPAEAKPIPPPPPAALVVAPCPPAIVVDEGPIPETGWVRGRRAPMYVNMMLFAGGLAEDGDNRLTTRDSKFLEGFGGMLRIGAVLDRHHRLGGRMQSFVRPTKKIALAPDSTATPSNEWGAVTFGYFGPEYLYTSDYGFYGGASLGVGFAISARDIDDHEHSKNDDNLEKGSGGLAGMISAGYEWRVNKWFALNVEAFGGLYHGVDDDEYSMNGALVGLGMGAGF